MKFFGALPWAIGCTLLAAGCQPRRPPVEADAARLTGISGAIVFRSAGGPAPALAADTTLTFDQAVRLCLMHDPRIQAALAKVRMAEADAGQARLLPNPVLAIDFRFPTEAGSGQTVEASLAADILSLLQKPGQIAAADKRLRGSAADALSVVLDVMEEVEESYLAIQSFEPEIENAQARTALFRRMATIAQKRMDAGEGSRLELLTLQSQLGQAQLDERDLAEQLRVERLHLARLLGAVARPITWELTPVAPVFETLAPEESFIAGALLNRPELQAKRWELQALGDDLAAASFAPLTGGELGVHSEHDPSWRVGPALSVPLPMFDFGQAARAKITAQRLAARAEYQELQGEIVQNVRTTYGAYLYARDALANMQQNLLPLQQQQRDQAQHAFEAGDADLSLLLLAEGDLRQLAVKSIELREKVAVARAQLMRAAGGAGIAAPLVRPQPATQPTSLPATGPAQ
jgi:outer membrane protein TolC